MEFLQRMLFVILIAVALSGCDLSASQNNLIFVTRPGMGIDKWSSIWLIKRHIAPGAEILWLPNDRDSSDDGVLFDTEKALYKRTGQNSTFSALIDGFNVNIDFLPSFIQLVHDVEINFWAPSTLVYSDLVETKFREMQATFGQENTPMPCYMEFFDNLQALMPELQQMNADSVKDLSQLQPQKTCSDKSDSQKAPRTNLVAEWPVETLLKAIQQHKKIVFVDVREQEEFNETHIPEAINIQIREFEQFDIKRLANADLVVPYCIKDFRGFEMARLLKQNGITNVALMRPYGFKGWVSVGLPTTSKTITDEQATKSLIDCANQPESCLKLGKQS